MHLIDLLTWLGEFFDSCFQAEGLFVLDMPVALAIAEDTAGEANWFVSLLFNCLAGVPLFDY